QWTGPNGFFSSIQSPTVNANTTNYSGTYQVTVTDANGCFATTTATALINPNPVPAITSGPNTGCAPLCVQFNVTSTPTAATMNWNLGDGTGAAGSTASTCYSVTGIYTISVVVADAAGCTGSATHTAQ
ncbi:MAG TPA: PKD domain-containing protein, partial [Bacteroidia bacterium]|nr:PKD domain-containing protein [Bacteroidia bacterium]